MKDALISDEKWEYWDAGTWSMLLVHEMKPVWSRVENAYDPDFQEHVNRGFNERGGIGQ